MQIQENVSLAFHTTFKLGGPARFFVSVETVEELQEAYAFAHDKNIPVFVLGGGSNTLVGENGFDGLVVQVRTKGVVYNEKENDHDNAVAVIAEAGEGWDSLVAQTVERGLWGLENLSGIPGTVGGAVVQNIGAYGAALSQTLAWVEALNTETGEVLHMTNAECKFEYRDSFFKHHPGVVVLRAAFVLSKAGTPDISYKDLQAKFAGTTPSVAAVRDAVLAIRHGKFPDLTQEGTAGSFFKNPIVQADVADALRAQFPDMPTFELPESSGVKVPLAWLLDHVLNARGLSVGGARLFEKQPLVIATGAHATAGDVQALATLVQTKIKDACNFDVEPEVKILL